MGEKQQASRFKVCVALFLLVPGGVGALAQKRPPDPDAANSSRVLLISSEPNASVWLDEILRGKTNGNGRLLLVNMKAGQHLLRVRAGGFKEAGIAVSPSQRGEIRVHLVRTNDAAELAFQQAEEAREQAKDDASRQKAAECYRQALELRGSFPAAHLGLARVLMDLNDPDNALAQIEAARRNRPVYPEASAVEGRIYREASQIDEAIASFNRAIRESRGFQPEAHVGLGLIYEEKGEYDLVAREYQIAINQLSDTEPVIYQLLGAAYEKSGKYKEAVAAYEGYLKLAPNGPLAPAVRSIIDQLREQAPGPESQYRER
jgi:tetratricopeptide (TPR) repeat protein